MESGHEKRAQSNSPERATFAEVVQVKKQRREDEEEEEPKIMQLMQQMQQQMMLQMQQFGQNLGQQIDRLNQDVAEMKKKDGEINWHAGTEGDELMEEEAKPPAGCLSPHCLRWHAHRAGPREGRATPPSTLQTLSTLRSKELEKSVEICGQVAESSVMNKKNPKTK